MSWEYDGTFVAEDDDALVDWAIDNVEKGTEVGLYFKEMYDYAKEQFEEWYDFRRVFEEEDPDYDQHYETVGVMEFKSFGDWFRGCTDTIDMDLRWVEDEDEEDIEG